MSEVTRFIMNDEYMMLNLMKRDGDFFHFYQGKDDQGFWIDNIYINRVLDQVKLTNRDSNEFYIVELPEEVHNEELEIYLRKFKVIFF